MKTNQPAGREPPRQRVRIEFHDEQAEAIFIAGTFNEWRPESTPMIHLGEGRWVKELTLPPGRYEYRIVADGEWRTDPTAGECVPNGLGECNCVLVVPPTRKRRSAS